MDATVTDVTDLRVRPPLTIEKDERRSFVRLQISSPLTVSRIKDIFGKFAAEGKGEVEAEILNLSASGVLVELDQPLNEGDVVGMRFDVEGIDGMSGVLGLVKRSEIGEDFHLAGIQFVSRDQLSDTLSTAELDLISDNFTDFDQSVREVLGRHIYRESN
jgi:hypothetical protein